MAKKITIRYRKPEWREWVYVRLNEDEIEKTVAALQEQGYIVER